MLMGRQVAEQALAEIVDRLAGALAGFLGGVDRVAAQLLRALADALGGQCRRPMMIFSPAEDCFAFVPAFRGADAGVAARTRCRRRHRSARQARRRLPRWPRVRQNSRCCRPRPLHPARPMGWPAMPPTLIGTARLARLVCFEWLSKFRMQGLVPEIDVAGADHGDARRIEHQGLRAGNAVDRGEIGHHAIDLGAVGRAAEGHQLEEIGEHQARKVVVDGTRHPSPDEHRRSIPP